METLSNPTPDSPASGSGTETSPLSADGLVLVPLAAAALDPSVFSKVNASEAIPASWEDRARKAWEYYLEDPLVKNCVNSWRTFAVGDEIKIAGDDEKVKIGIGKPSRAFPPTPPGIRVRTRAVRSG